MQARQWWPTSLTSASGGRDRWTLDLAEFKASLVYRVRSRTARNTQRNPFMKNKQKECQEIGNASTF